MKWKVDDSIVHWLKVRSESGKAYFILWEQDPDFLAIDLLPVIPSNPAESTELTVPLAAGELPWLREDELATSVIRDQDLVKLWRKERRKFEKTGDLEPLGKINPRRRKTRKPRQQ
jgi:hypothetical protein